MERSTRRSTRRQREEEEKKEKEIPKPKKVSTEEDADLRENMILKRVPCFSKKNAVTSEDFEKEEDDQEYSDIIIIFQTRDAKRGQCTTRYTIKELYNSTTTYIQNPDGTSTGVKVMKLDTGSHWIINAELIINPDERYAQHVFYLSGGDVKLVGDPEHYVSSMFRTPTSVYKVERYEKITPEIQQIEKALLKEKERRNKKLRQRQAELEEKQKKDKRDALNTFLQERQEMLVRNWVKKLTPQKYKEPLTSEELYEIINSVPFRVKIRNFIKDNSKKIVYNGRTVEEEFEKQWGIRTPKILDLIFFADIIP